jgi:hypothetical protein
MVIKSKGMRRARHVARAGEIRNTYNILIGKHKGKRPLRRPRGVDERIILEWILEKRG